MKLSLMTLNLIPEIYSKLQSGGSMEEAAKEFDDMMAMAKRVGFEAVEIAPSEIDMLGLEIVKGIVTKNHLEVSSYIHFGPFATLDKVEGVRAVAEGIAAVDRAVALGTKVIMMVPIAKKNILNYKRKDLANQLIKHWIPIVEYATKKELHIVVEDIPNLAIPLCTMEELQYVLNHVPNLKVVYDSGNMILVNEDPVEYYDSFANRTEHIHLKDMRVVKEEHPHLDVSMDGIKMTGALHGKGLVDFKTLLSHIKNNGYEGYFTVEYMPLGEECLYHEENLRNAVAYLNSLY